MTSPPGGDEQRLSVPPARPGMSWSAPPPIPRTPSLPRTVRTARTLWVLSFLAGLTVLAGSFAARDSNLQRLRAVVADTAPRNGLAPAGTAADIVFWASMGALLLVTLLEALALAAVLSRRAWARWVLFTLLASHLPVLLLASAVLVPTGASGSYVVMLWVAGVALAFGGLVLLFLPPAGAWLRKGRSLG